MAKQRVHNEYFRPVSLGGRKSCPTCRGKLKPGESIWSWGEYIRAKWHTVDYFCKECFAERVLPLLERHMGECGCSFKLNAYHCQLPEWLELNQTCNTGEGDGNIHQSV